MIKRKFSSKLKPKQDSPNCNKITFFKLKSFKKAVFNKFKKSQLITINVLPKRKMHTYFKSSEFWSSQHSRFNNYQTRAKLTGLKIQLIQDVSKVNKIINFNIACKAITLLTGFRNQFTRFCETRVVCFRYWLLHPVSMIIEDWTDYNLLIWMVSKVESEYCRKTANLTWC